MSGRVQLRKQTLWSLWRFWKLWDPAGPTWVCKSPSASSSCGFVSPPTGGSTLSTCFSRGRELPWQQSRWPSSPSALPSPSRACRSIYEPSQSETSCQLGTSSEGHHLSWHWDIGTRRVALACSSSALIELSQWSSGLNSFGQRSLKVWEHVLMMHPDGGSHFNSQSFCCDQSLLALDCWIPHPKSVLSS